MHPRRKAFAQLDRDGNGELRFEEWAIRTIEKFEGADANGDGLLTREEYATSAPKPRKKKPACKC
ncbi:Ca2+-binding EF-hand superfamily protein [Sphingomicrobium lutaoense]|uniref:Ca2+-binding EF-hand superfamily protein n=1 Tax=Sphingomicrobium lutaoense TaxID=515949 RepID=A0A839YXH3_9SPHN|nr:Ca2+-binding EF-hand superfamily protein [Sphingomicrobium lutaoense]